jgi:guanosine-3',5'-bis(diphosphate) 3'-pyrophosphohydrolase
VADLEVPSTAADVESPATSRPASRVRARLARFAGSRPSAVPEIEPLISTLQTYHPKADVGLVQRAYEIARREHEGQLRKSGEPYITHPLAVAQILAGQGMTETTLAAALLHDTVEDTTYSLADLTADFGDEIAMLVDGVTKLDKATYGEASHAETVRKMVVAMSRDIRVLVIKLADRLHNARTWQFVSRESARRKARETLDIYAPLAHRLGMNRIKWELEDLSFQTLEPKIYNEIVREVADRTPTREEYLGTVISDVSTDLRAAKVKAEITGRPKHYYSIYQKHVVRGRDFADIYDLIGIRILVESVRDCYAVLGVIHARWRPIPGRFKDFIAMPKLNMYQSLHTTVVGPEGRPVELQIRTYAMHRRAEDGVAAHWKYKEDSRQGRDRPPASPEGGPSDMAWLRQLLDWQRETSDPGEFLESLREEITSSEVYVFTPKGDIKALPKGATPVDFAYAVHTEVGHHTIGAKVNGRLVPLESKLDNGDIVEVVTSKAEGAGPSRDWLVFVASARARNKIKQWFSKERREEAAEKGRDAIARAMRKQDLPLQRMLTSEALTGVAADLRYSDISAMYAAVGEGNVSAQSVVERLAQTVGGTEGSQEDAAEVARPGARARRRASSDPGVVVEGMSDIWVKLAKDCTPVPGDEIVGFVTRGARVSVHRAGCPSLEQMHVEPERFVEVSWAPNAASVFLVAMQVDALDRSHLLSDITRALSEHHVNILSAHVTTNSEGLAKSRFTFEMADPKHLSVVLSAVRTVDGVYDAFRVTNN